jgi:hypothetical protein
MRRSALTRHTATRVAGAFAVTVVAFFMQASAASAGPSITVSPSSAPQGGPVVISGNVPVSGTPSCASGDPAQLTSTADLFPPDGLGPQAARDTSGNFSTNYTIPASTPVDSYSIGLRCGGGNVGIGTTLQVTALTPAAPIITVSPTSAHPGDSVAITGVVPPKGTRSCPSVDGAQLTSTAELFPPDGFGPQVSRDAAGRFDTDYTIPSAAVPGTYSIGVRCGGGNVGVSAALQITRPATTTTVAATSTAPGATGAPAGTAKGTSSVVWIVLGALVVLIAAGVALFFFRRKGVGASS